MALIQEFENERIWHENRAWVEAVFQKLPFLGSHFDKDILFKVSLEHLTLEVLQKERKVQYHSYWSDFWDQVITTKQLEIKNLILIFDAEGNLLGQVNEVRPAPLILPKYQWLFFGKEIGKRIVQRKSSILPESILSCINRLGIDKAYYVVGLLRDAGSPGRLIVSIPPGGMTLHACLAYLEREEAQKGIVQDRRSAGLLLEASKKVDSEFDQLKCLGQVS